MHHDFHGLRLQQAGDRERGASRRHRRDRAREADPSHTRIRRRPLQRERADQSPPLRRHRDVQRIDVSG